MNESENMVTFIEWRGMSVKGEVCAIMGCRNDPKHKCQECFFHYCYEHGKDHGHRLSWESCTGADIVATSLYIKFVNYYAYE